MRPGEKLYEELLIGDNVEKTSHPLIMRAQEAEIAWDVLQQKLQQLDAACVAFNHEQVRTLLQELVAEYEPQCGIEDFLFQPDPLSTAILSAPASASTSVLP